MTVFATVLVAVVSLAVSAQPGEPPIMAKVKSLYSKNKAFESAFNHHTRWEIREKEESVDGRIVLAPGNRFRVEMGDAVWVGNGKTLWQYSAKTGQVTIRGLAATDISSHPSQLFADYVDSRSYRQVEATSAQIVVESSDSLGSVGVVRMWVDKKTAVIKRLAFSDKNGNRHTYQFTKTRFNPGVPEKTFEFTAPKNAQVLDLRD